MKKKNLRLNANLMKKRKDKELRLDNETVTFLFIPPTTLSIEYSPVS